MSSSAPPELSLVVSTYESPQALDVVLQAVSELPGSDFEVVVADDGSGPETESVVRHWSATLGSRLQHSWQPDKGYRKTRVLNLGVLASTGTYLLFIDGDCLPRSGLRAALHRAALPGWFLASKRLHLSPRLSDRVLIDRVPVWRWSSTRLLAGAPRELVRAPRETGRPGVLLPVRDRRRPWRPDQPDFSPPFDAYGFFLGVSRDDFDRVNGFDTRFVGWGGEDVDLAARLRRSGLRCGWPGPQATMLHLWHPEKMDSAGSNRMLVRETLEGTHIEALEGLRELASEVGNGAIR